MAKSLNYQLPDKYKLDYMVYTAGKDSDPEIFWNMPYAELCKTMMFKRFDAWFQKEYSKSKESR